MYTGVRQWTTTCGVSTFKGEKIYTEKPRLGGLRLTMPMTDSLCVLIRRSIWSFLGIRKLEIDPTYSRYSGAIPAGFSIRANRQVCLKVRRVLIKGVLCGGEVLKGREN